MSDAIKDRPLREVCKDAERLTRELIDHLEKNLVPGTREVHDMIRSSLLGEEVPDLAVRNQVAALLERQEFADDLYRKAKEYFQVINDALGEMAGSE